MSPQPIASGVGHGAASPVPQSGIEKIHGSDYGLQFEGADCIDPTDGLRGDFWLVMKKNRWRVVCVTSIRGQVGLPRIYFHTAKSSSRTRAQIEEIN